MEEPIEFDGRRRLIRRRDLDRNHPHDPEPLAVACDEGVTGRPVRDDFI
jgi:hypothetical protein